VDRADLLESGHTPLVNRSAAGAPLLAGLLAGAGVLHLVWPGPFETIVPGFLPAAPTVLLSGLAELTCAAAVASRRWRRRGALATAALFVVVFPANVQMALDAHGLAGRTIAYARLPLQVPLVLWALRVRRSAR
jgi:uncharacterized membrane protein